MDYREYKAIVTANREDILHFGVLGMHWGHRKSYAELSTRKQKKVLKEYKKEANKAINEINEKQGHRNVKAYNQMADEMNNGGIDKFNKTHSSKSKDYTDAYNKLTNKIMTQKYNELAVKDLQSNKHYKKAKALADSYSLEKYDKLVKDNADLIKKFQKSN